MTSFNILHPLPKHSDAQPRPLNFGLVMAMCMVFLGSAGLSFAHDGSSDGSHDGRSPQGQGPLAESWQGSDRAVISFGECPGETLLLPSQDWRSFLSERQRRVANHVAAAGRGDAAWTSLQIDGRHGNPAVFSALFSMYAKHIMTAHTVLLDNRIVESRDIWRSLVEWYKKNLDLLPEKYQPELNPYHEKSEVRHTALLATLAQIDSLVQDTRKALKREKDVFLLGRGRDLDSDNGEIQEGHRGWDHRLYSMAVQNSLARLSRSQDEGYRRHVEALRSSGLSTMILAWDDYLTLDSLAEARPFFISSTSIVYDHMVREVGGLRFPEAGRSVSMQELLERARVWHRSVGKAVEDLPHGRGSLAMGDGNAEVSTDKKTKGKQKSPEQALRDAYSVLTNIFAKHHKTFSDSLGIETVYGQVVGELALPGRQRTANGYDEMLGHLFDLPGLAFQSGGFRARFESRLGTMVLTLPQDKMQKAIERPMEGAPAGATAKVLMLHGSGTTRSSGASIVSVLGIVGDLGVAAAMDLPNAGLGMPLGRLEDVLDYFRVVSREVRSGGFYGGDAAPSELWERLDDRPVTLVTRSASGPLGMVYDAREVLGDLASASVNSRVFDQNVFQSYAVPWTLRDQTESVFHQAREGMIPGVILGSLEGVTSEAERDMIPWMDRYLRTDHPRPIPGTHGVLLTDRVGVRSILFQGNADEDAGPQVLDDERLVLTRHAPNMLLYPFHDPLLIYPELLNYADDREATHFLISSGDNWTLDSDRAKKLKETDVRERAKAGQVFAKKLLELGVQEKDLPKPRDQTFELIAATMAHRDLIASGARIGFLTSEVEPGAYSDFVQLEDREAGRRWDQLRRDQNVKSFFWDFVLKQLAERYQKLNREAGDRNPLNQNDLRELKNVFHRKILEKAEEMRRSAVVRDGHLYYPQHRDSLEHRFAHALVRVEGHARLLRARGTVFSQRP